MEFSKIYKFGAPIHHVVFSNEFLAAIDNETNILFFDRKSDKLTAKQKFDNPIPHPHHKSSNSNITGHLLCIYLEKTKSSYLLVYKREQNKFVPAKKLEWAAGLLECVAFDRQNKLFATGGNDGKVFVYSCKNGKLYTSLPKKSDYIANLAFNKDGNLLAYSGFDRSISIYDLHRSKMLYVGNGQLTSVVMALKFLNESNKIVLAGRDGKVVLYDFFKKKVIKTLAFCPSWPLSLYVSENDDFALISDKSGNIHLCDLTDESSESVIIHKAPYAVLDIRIFGHSLCFVFENGEVKCIDLESSYKEFEKAYEEQNYLLCYKMIKENRLLCYTDIKKKIDDTFSDILKKAITKISAGEEAEAKKMLEPFTNDEKFSIKIKRNLNLAKKIFEFTKTVKKDDYVKAYRLATSDEICKEFPAYEQLEKKFADLFDKASDLLVKKPPDIKEAKKLLDIFLEIPAKYTLVKNLFVNPVVFKKAQLLYQKKDYLLAESIVEKYPMIKEAPFYKEFSDFKSNLEFFFELHMDMQEFAEALEVAHTAEKYFPEIYKKMKPRIDKLKITMSFIKSVEESSFFAALGYVSRNEFLIDLPEYKKLDRFLDKKFDLATEYARKLMLEEMNKILSPFIKNKNLKNRASSIYKLFYIEQIQKEVSAFKEAEWRIVIENYRACFGIDDEIIQLAKNNNIESLLGEFEKEEYEKFTPECIKPYIYKKQ